MSAPESSSSGISGHSICYATSRDGLRWEKPDLEVVPDGGNQVLAGARDSNIVWLDHEETDPARRYKMFTMVSARSAGATTDVIGNNTAGLLRFSADGIHWTAPQWTSGVMRDRSTLFYNPFRKVWVYSIKMRPTARLPNGRSSPRTRSRAYRETRDLLAPWRDEEVVPWVGADSLDRPRNAGVDLQTIDGQQLYNLDAVAYESLMLGLFAIFHGNGVAGREGHHHMNDLTIGFSRDGFHWDRRNREPFLPVGRHPNDWNWTNVQSAEGGCLVVGDTLYFYCSGRAHDAATGKEGTSTGLATLRRDGFASMDAGEDGGILVTRPHKFTGRHLFVNTECPDGELRVSILQEGISDFVTRIDPVLTPFTAENCAPIRTDSTIQRVT